MKRLTGTNKEIAELLYQEQLELSKENRDVESTNNRKLVIRIV